MSAKKRLVIGNWKMHPGTLTEARKIFDGVKRGVARAKRATIVICPPTIYLSDLIGRYRGTKLLFGAQDASMEAEGSHTGEISPCMLKRLGVSHVILGHSERRALGESDDEVASKLKTAQAAGLKTVLCVGERQRDVDGLYLQNLEDQIKRSLKGIAKKSISKLIVAYEPIWAIGKRAKDAMKPDDVYETLLFIKKILSKLYGRKHGFSVPIIYGGSVEPANAEALWKDSGADGFLPGHASLNPKDFSEIVQIVDRL